MSSSSSSSHSSYVTSSIVTPGAGCISLSALFSNYSSLPVREGRYGHTYCVLGTDGNRSVIRGIKKRLGEQLPHGGFGVIKAAEGPHGEDWVRKIAWLNRGDASQDAAIMVVADSGVRAIEKLKGKSGIVPYHGHERYVNKVGKIKEVIFMDRADGDLGRRLKEIESHPFDQKTQLSLANQLLEALAVSFRGGAHGDLKPENILLKNSGKAVTLWLCDFDFYCESKGPWFRGTLNYMAPEILFEHTCYNVRKLDVRAAGMVLFYIFTNTFDYPGKKAPCAFPWMQEVGGEETSIKRIKQAIGEFSREKIQALLDKEILNPKLQELLLGVLDPDWKTRWTIDEAYAYFRLHVLKNQL